MAPTDRHAHTHTHKHTHTRIERGHMRRGHRPPAAPLSVFDRRHRRSDAPLLACARTRQRCALCAGAAELLLLLLLLLTRTRSEPEPEPEPGPGRQVARQRQSTSRAVCHRADGLRDAEAGCACEPPCPKGDLRPRTLLAARCGALGLRLLSGRRSLAVGCQRTPWAGRAASLHGHASLHARTHGRQAGRQADRQADRQTGRETCGLSCGRP